MNKKPPHKSDTGLSIKTLQIIRIVFAVFFLGLIVVFIWTTPCPTTAQYLIFRLILTLILAILAGTFLTGKIKLTYKIGISATGGFAVLVMFVFLKDPKSIDFLSRCDQPIVDSIEYKIQLIDAETKTLVHFSNAILVVEAKELKEIKTLPVNWGGIVTFSVSDEIKDSCRLELNNVAPYELPGRKFLLRKNMVNEIFVVKKRPPPPPPPPPPPQYEMAGTVFDANGNTVSNVRVFTSDGTVETKTDHNGHFRFKIKTTHQTIDLFFSHPTLGNYSETTVVGNKNMEVMISK